MSELEELETISTEIELLDNYITPSKKAIVQVEYDMAEEKLWGTTVREIGYGWSDLRAALKSGKPKLS